MDPDPQVFAEKNPARFGQEGQEGEGHGEHRGFGRCRSQGHGGGFHHGKHGLGFLQLAAEHLELGHGLAVDLFGQGHHEILEKRYITL